ncbi:ATP-dependent DNA helicase RecQ [Methanoculleus taiwanensis]|uniref:DNA 3'-5' helicase n=1 Tax=Methanoculleus taiwanensis TaxID=1550565 RepID=A0A498GXK1_9EURY|nr:RecQ family ATP-dependent DNA helicase [Methanoculleus taiwanensis]RXE55263.1 ATP-dependent DNA helicase RecQ [Methanoculleus taiwanensis]
MAPIRLILERYFGHREFQPYQEEIIGDLLKKRDVLAVLATGGGKSLCYQLPALLGDGTTLVVSPLIALMKDQVDELQARGVAAESLNSSVSYTKLRQITTDLAENRISLLYLSPERAVSREFLKAIADVRISLIAIDEAHCISMWGHQFRPEYRDLRLLKERFPDTPVVALTATATPDVREDIIRQLNLCDPKVYVGTFDRKNLRYSVERRGADVYSRIRAYLQQHPGEAGIVYCATRDQTESLARRLKEDGFLALPYHAGLSTRMRSRAQEQFLAGEIPIIAATTAFGMGIDKQDVRFVMHDGMPRDLEAYYQETGRAGRDGKPGDCILFYDEEDERRIRQLIARDYSSELQREIARKKLDAFSGYCKTTECRRRWILSYFGEENGKERCGACDNCTQKRRAKKSGSRAAPRAGII